MTASIRTKTGRIIRRLYGNGVPDKAVLANLRQSDHLNSPRAVSVWPLLMSELDERDLSESGNPSAAETAIFATLHLYAVHQQGYDAIVYGPWRGSDDEKGVLFFSALARLRADPDKRVAIDRRVRQLLAVTNIDAVINDLNSLVGIVKGAQLAVRIDYAQLAEDLYWIQQSYENANRVRLVWGQQYYQLIQPNEGKDNDEK